MTAPVITDSVAPLTPMWWLNRLGRRLAADQLRFQILEDYASGNHPLPEGDTRVRDAYKRFQRKARSNYVGLVSESVLERMHIQGFRMGGTGDQKSDSDADRIWQANHLDADSTLVHRAMLDYSRAYAIVGPPDDRGIPVVTPESPRQVITEADPVNRRKIRAALKTWVDDADRLRHAVVYLPDEIHHFTSQFVSISAQDSSAFARESTTYASAGATWTHEDVFINPVGVVPVVPFLNRPTLDGDSLGEFEDVVDIQDRINNTLLDRLVISKMQAYRQRWVKGIDIPTDDNGDPIPPFNPGSDLLWATESETAQFGDFAESSLDPLLKAIEADIRDLAAISRTPPHYLLGAMVNLSGDALAAAETGLVAKVKERQRTAGEAWEQVMRLAFRYLDDARANTVDSETLWADPENRTLAEKADAAVKLKGIGYPFPALAALVGATPAEISRMEADRAADAFLTGAVPPGAGALAVSEVKRNALGDVTGIIEQPSQQAAPPARP